MDQAIGERFARAIATKDRVELQNLLDPDVDFLGMTPGRFWEAASAAALVDDVILGAWFESGDDIVALESVQAGSVADRASLVYRVRITNPDGVFLVEQHAYYAVENERISWLRIMCSGYREIDS